MRSRRVGLLLSGCGVHDGSDIHEAVLALLALERAGATVTVLAPNVAQAQVVNHQTGDAAVADVRNALAESARIGRGPAQDLASIAAGRLDALVITGGFGVTKTLCDYASRGRACAVHPDAARLLDEMCAAHKPIVSACLAGLLVARVLGSKVRPLVTIGNDVAMEADVVSWGARHERCGGGGIIVDRDNRIVSTPAYLVAQTISEAAEGIDRAVRALMEWA